MPSHDSPSAPTEVARGGIPSSAAPSEEERIRIVYEKRQSGDARYSWGSPSRLFTIQERERHVIAMLRRHGFFPIAGKTILDVGCGSGFWIREFIKWGARAEAVSGVELCAERIDEARQRCPGGVRLECRNAVELPFESHSCDLVVQSTMFTSVLDSEVKQRIATEMRRVVKPDGVILWYDFLRNNPRNPDVRGIGKREIHALFSGCQIELRRISLAPPLARWLVPRSWLAGYVLAACPFLCTHYLGVIRSRSP